MSSQATATLNTLLKEGTEPIFAPLVLNPLMAMMAQREGFKSLYFGGGAMGYLTCFTEANLSLTEMSQHALDIRTACDLPLILDGACGWGDPMHIRRTVRMAETAGFSAIEIEDQLQPKRAHHHIGIEHVVPLDVIVAKIEEAVAARRSSDFLIIARTNTALQESGLDEALRRGEAMHRAGADLLLVLPRKAEHARIIGEELPGPKVFMMVGQSLLNSGLTNRELFDLGYRIFVDPTSPLMAMHRALRDCYAALRNGQPDPLVGPDTRVEREILHETIELETLLAIERRTVEK